MSYTMKIIASVYSLTLLITIVIPLINVTQALPVDYDDYRPNEYNPVKFGRKQRVPVSMERCTRRFTPGRCSDSVTSVWTFVAQIQNCTERQGCRIPTRTNRFPSYHRCMWNCRSFVVSDVLYNESVMYEPHGMYGRDGTHGAHGIETIATLGAADSSNPRREGIHELPDLSKELDWQGDQHERAAYFKHLVNDDDEGSDNIDDDDDGPLLPGRDVEELETREQWRPLNIDDFNDYV